MQNKVSFSLIMHSICMQGKNKKLPWEDSKMKIKSVGIICAALMMSGTVSIAAAGEVKLPKNMSWTAYNTGTTGYNQSVAIGKALKDKYDVTLRVVPGKNDISRLTPIKAGKIDYSANGIATFFASEGVFQFADPAWGPMPVRVLLSASGSAGLSVAVAADKGIKTYADLKGKRVAYVRGGDALNVGNLAGQIDQGARDAPAPHVGADHQGLDPENRPVDQVEIAGIQPRAFPVDRPDRLLVQPGEHDLLVRLGQGIGEMGGEGRIVDRRAEQVGPGCDVERLDLREQGEVGVPVLCRRRAQVEDGSVAHGSRRNW